MNSFAISTRSFSYQSFSESLKLIEIEANQADASILLCAEFAKNRAKANFADLGEKNLVPMGC